MRAAAQSALLLHRAGAGGVSCSCARSATCASIACPPRRSIASATARCAGRSARSAAGCVRRARPRRCGRSSSRPPASWSATGVRLRSETPERRGGRAFSHGFDGGRRAPEGVRFVVPGGKGIERVLELAWPDGRREVDRDTEIAIDIFCEHLGDALELLNAPIISGRSPARAVAPAAGESLGTRSLPSAGAEQRRDFLFVQSTRGRRRGDACLQPAGEQPGASPPQHRRQPELRGRQPARAPATASAPRSSSCLGRGSVDPIGVGRTLVRLRALIKERGVRVVIGNGAHPQIVGGLVARLAGIRSTVPGPHDPRASPVEERRRSTRSRVASPCDLMLAVSKASLATLEKLRPKVAKRVLYDGTPMREVSADEARRARAELGIREGEVLFGVFGRLQRWKGQDVFVEAAAEVARRWPQARFAIVGRLGLRPRARFPSAAQATGRRADLSERLIFRVFARTSPSRHGGFRRRLPHDPGRGAFRNGHHRGDGPAPRP